MFTKQSLLENILFFGCLAFASYFTIIQFIRYGRNEDVSVLSYRQLKFDSESEDQYPTYTICLVASYKTIVKRDSHVWTSNLVEYEAYKSLLKGNLANAMSKKIIRKLSNINFEEVIIDHFNDRIITLFTKCNDITCFEVCREIGAYYECVSKNPFFIKSHQSPEETCYSRKFSYQPEYDLSTDTLFLNGSKLIELGLHLHIYVHQAGRFIRHINTMNSPKVTEFYYWELQDLLKVYKQGLLYELTNTINDVVVLRKREDSVEKCNKSLLNEDKKWRDEIKKMVGCLPAYWSTFESNSTLKQSIPYCSSDQYLYLRGKIWWTQSQKFSKEYFKNISNLYTNPCSQMDNGIRTRSKRISNKSKKLQLTLEFKYGKNRYLEIKNNRAYDDETLLSQVGGFIGIQIVSKNYKDFNLKRVCTHLPNIALYL